MTVMIRYLLLQVTWGFQLWKWSHGTIANAHTFPPPISDVNPPSPAEYQNLFRRALQEPNSMSVGDIQILAATICQSAIRKVNYAMPAAEFCVTVIERCERAQQDWGEMFLENVMLFCRELFNRRDEILRPPDEPTIRSRRWVAYVTFLAELIEGLSDEQDEHTAGPSLMVGAHAAKARSKLVLSTLICFSCHTMLQPPSLYNPSEMDCLQTALTTAGAALEHDAPRKTGGRHARDSGRLRNAAPAHPLTTGAAGIDGAQGIGLAAEPIRRNLNVDR
ncbi:hypothetical protein MTO96_050484 [Rhipicephalus appendiculatus]